MKLFKQSPINDLKGLSEIVQLKVNSLFDACGGSPAPGTNLDQAGLKEGNKIIEDYIEHGEAGLAFEHLQYMIKETEIELNDAEQKSFSLLHKIYTN